MTLFQLCVPAGEPYNDTKNISKRKLWRTAHMIQTNEKQKYQSLLPQWGHYIATKPGGYRTFFMLNSAKHESFSAINMKMPTIVGIFIFITREMFMLSYV